MTGQAVRFWEDDEHAPVQQNLDKLLELLPELAVAIEAGAVLRPRSQDIPVPEGNRAERDGSLTRPASPARLLLAAPPSAGLSPATCPLPEIAPVPPGPFAEQDVSRLSVAYGLARVVLARAQRDREAAQAVLDRATDAEQRAAREVSDLLRLLDLAVEEIARDAVAGPGIQRRADYATAALRIKEDFR